MSISDAPADPRPQRTTAGLAREIETECGHALRLVDRLLSESDDVLLACVRLYLRRAAILSEQIVRTEQRC